MTWHLRPGEDLLLHAYAQRRRGALWREVPVRHGKSRTRRIDGVLIPTLATDAAPTSVPWTTSGLIEVIEVKQVLDETVIGQAAAARVTAEDQGATHVHAVALVGRVDDQALADVCAELGIVLVIERPSVVVTLGLNEDDPLWTAVDGLVKNGEASTAADAILKLAAKGAALDP